MKRGNQPILSDSSKFKSRRRKNNCPYFSWTTSKLADTRMNDPVSHWLPYQNTWSLLQCFVYPRFQVCCVFFVSPLLQLLLTHLTSIWCLHVYRYEDSYHQVVYWRGVQDASLFYALKNVQMINQCKNKATSSIPSVIVES